MANVALQPVIEHWKGLDRFCAGGPALSRKELVSGPDISGDGSAILVETGWS